MHSSTLRKFTLPLLAFAFALCLAPAFALAGEPSAVGASEAGLTPGAIATMSDDNGDDPESGGEEGGEDEGEADAIVGVEYHHEGTVELTEAIDGSWEPGEDGEDPWFRYEFLDDGGEFSDGLCAVGDTVTVTYSSGAVATYTYAQFQDPENEGAFEYSWADETGEASNAIWVSFEEHNAQASNHWEAGTTQQIDIHVNDSDVYDTFDVQISVNPVSSITFEPAKPYEFIEDYDGEMTYGSYLDKASEEWVEGDFFMYRWGAVHAEGNYTEGDTLTVQPLDGEQKSYSFKDEYESNDVYYSRVFVNKNDPEDIIPGEKVYSQTDQELNNKWGVGEHSVTIKYNGRTCEVPVTIVANPIESIEYAPANVEGHSWFVEYFDAYEEEKYDENGDVCGTYDCYRYSDFENGDELTINYTNGESATFTYQEVGVPGVDDEGEEYTDYFFRFVGPDGNYIEPGDVSAADNQRSWSPWQINDGEDKHITYTYMNRSVDVDVCLIASPVDHIEFTSERGYSSPEHVDGYWENKGSEDEWFRYYLPFIGGDANEHPFNSGDELTVYYKDGWDPTSATYKCEGDYFYDVESGESLTNRGDRWNLIATSDQDENHWDLGDHAFTVSYGGASVKVPFKVIENDVESIEFIPLHEYKVYENYDGHYWMDDDVKTNAFIYDAYFSFEEGDKLFVTRKGSSTPVEYVYTYRSEEEVNYDGDYEIDPHSGEPAFVNVGDPDDLIYSSDVNRHEGDQTPDNLWTIEHPGAVVLEYNGCSYEVPVTVSPFPLTKLIYIPANPVVGDNDYCLRDGGHYDDDYNWVENIWHEYIYTPSEGDKLVLVDDAKKQETTYVYGYDEGTRGYVFKNDSEDVLDNRYLSFETTDQSYDKQWSIGYADAKVRAVYLGVESDWVSVSVCGVVKETPELDNDIFEYTGKPLTALAAKTGYTVTGGVQTDVGEYTATATCEHGFVFDDGSTVKTFSWRIDPAVIEVPDQKELTYNGKSQTGVAAGAFYTIKGNAATSAGEYTATLTCDKNHIFDWGYEVVEVDWVIEPAEIATPSGKTLTYNGKSQTGVAAGTGYTVEGGSATNADEYEAIATCDANHVFDTGDTEEYIEWEIVPASIAKAKVALKAASAAYTGKAQKGAVKSVKLGSTTLKAANYSVSAKLGKAVGSYAVTVTGEGNYTGSAKATFKVTQAKNTAKAAKTSVKKTVKLATLKKKAQTVALPKVTAKFGKAKWKVSTKDKKKVLTLKGNKIQVKKGAKKGTYTIKLKASVAKTKNYKAATTKVVTVKVTVK